jgi:hypothetical protein
MHTEEHFNLLCHYILSNNFAAFQKTLHEIAENRVVLEELLYYNDFDDKNNQFTLVQVATAYALQTGQTEMLNELIELGAKTSWQTDISRPVLNRQEANYGNYHDAEYFVGEEHMYDGEENNNEPSDQLPGEETDSVDAVFERAAVAGNLHATAILSGLRKRGAVQLTQVLDSIILNEPELNQITPIIFSDILENDNYTTLLEQVMNTAEPKSGCTKIKSNL